MTKVLFVITALNNGGAERLLVDTVQALRDVDDIEVAVCALHDGPLRHEIEHHDIRVHVAPFRKDLPYGHRFYKLANPLVLPWLAWIFSHEHPDLIHSHLPKAGIHARLVARAMNIPSVYSEHNIWSSYHRLSRWANRWSIALESSVVAVSHAVVDSMGEGIQSIRDLNVVHNGIQLGPEQEGDKRDTRARLRNELGIDLDAFVVGTVANLHPKKTIDTLLDALCLLKDRVPSIQYICVGRDDGDGPRLRQRARDVGVDGIVSWLGFRADARRLMGAMDVFVLPSLYEGFPLVVLEAMDTGLPIVASNVGGIPEAVDHEVTGLLVAPKDPQALAESVLRLAENEGERSRMGAAGRDRAHREFSTNQMVEQTLRIYRRHTSLH